MAKVRQDCGIEDTNSHINTGCRRRSFINWAFETNSIARSDDNDSILNC